MKYLKKYNESNIKEYLPNISEIVSVCRDILLPIKDMNNNIWIAMMPAAVSLTGKKNDLRINISTYNHKGFNLISDNLLEIERLLSYLKGEKIYLERVDIFYTRISGDYPPKVFNEKDLLNNKEEILLKRKIDQIVFLFNYKD